MGYAAVDPDVRQIAEAAAKRFTDLGCQVEEAHPGFADPPSLRILSTANAPPEWRTDGSPSVTVSIPRWPSRSRRDALSAVDFVRASNVRRTLNDVFVRFFSR